MTRVWFGLFGIAIGLFAATVGYLLARWGDRRFRRAFDAANEPMRRCLRETEAEFKALMESDKARLKPR